MSKKDILSAILVCIFIFTSTRWIDEEHMWWALGTFFCLISYGWYITVSSTNELEDRLNIKIANLEKQIETLKQNN